MKGFLIKKAFFDGWDNMISMVLLNLLFVGLGTAGISLFAATPNPLLGYGVMIVFLIIMTFLLSAATEAAFNWSNYQGDTWQAVKRGFSRNWRHAILLSVMNVLMFTLSMVVLPFYFGMQGIVPFVLGVLLLGFQLVCLMALPYYWGLMDLLPGDRPLKTLKKCFIIVADNMGFTIFFSIYQILMFAVTIFTLGLVPGFAGIELLRQDAMKLLMKKYDYLEENPDADRKHLPWEDILYDEREKVGPRSFKSMIFPWKD